MIMSELQLVVLAWIALGVGFGFGVGYFVGVYEAKKELKVGANDNVNS